MPNPSESKKVNPFNLSDKEIIDIIYEYHGEPDGSFDEDSLFIIVRNILTRSTQIVDEVMLPGGGKAYAEKIAEQSPKPNFIVPLSILKQIGCELSCCKALVAETAHDTTVEILKKLKEYKWQAKAVMTLASFAMEFGDFSLLVDLDHSKKQDQLTRSLGILKGASSLISATTPDLLSQKQRRDEVVKLNELIKKTLEVMKIIIAIEERASYDPSAMSEIPTSAYVYWIINTVTACATKIAILTSNEGVALEALYSLYDGKVEGIKRKVAKDLEHFLQVEEEHKRFTELLQLSSDPKRVTEFLKSLLLTRDSKDTKIIDASDDISYKTVEINAVTEKKRLLIILSRPEISEADIDIIRPIQIEKIKEEKLDKDYGIVWMPIAEEKRQEYENAQKDFGGWVKSTKKIQWYSTARFVSEAPVIHFLKEKWYFKSDPIVVVLNVALGIVENLNAFYTIRLWRLDAFPYDEETEKNKFNEMTWVHTLFKDSTDFSPKWVKKESYNCVFLYGGTDNKKTNEMKEKIIGLQNTINDDTNLKDSKITVRPFYVEEKAEVKDIFWSGVDCLFLTKLYKSRDFAKRQIQKLYSYKNKEGWFILNKGPTTVILGHSATLLKVIAEFENWKDVVRQTPLEVAFRDYYNKVVASLLDQIGCCRIEIPPAAGKLPEEMKCAECEGDMRIITSYECCHKHRPIPLRP